MIEQAKEFKVSGNICVQETGSGIPNLIVEALDKDLFFDDRLGSVLTDESGNFEILYDREDFQELFFDLKPDIYLRVRKADGRVIYTTESAVRYEAGKTEAFYIPIPQSLIGEEANMKESNYQIEGKVSSDVLQEVPEGINLKVYAIRDRRLVASSAIGKEGNFAIEYKYRVYEEEGRKQAFGVYLVVAPEMPAEEIMQENFPKVFLESENFREQEGKFYVAISTETLHQLISKESIFKYLIPWWKRFCYQWQPWIEVVCPSSGLLLLTVPVPNIHVRIYEIREPSILLWPTLHEKSSVLVAEGDTDSNGDFKPEQTRCRFFWLYSTLGYRVEVGQIIDGAFHQVYIDLEDKLRDLKNDIPTIISIDRRNFVVNPWPYPYDSLPGKAFELSRIGNVPVGYLHQKSGPFCGYANMTSASLISAIPSIVDCAFYDTIKLFASIGDEIADTVQYYQIHFSYESNGKEISFDLQTPFYNLRESTPAEKASCGPYKTEFMGPMKIQGHEDEGWFYRYPNPRDKNINWIFLGLIAVIDTRTLPLLYSKYKITVSLKDANADDVYFFDLTTFLDEDDNGNQPNQPTLVKSTKSCTILVDNTAPTGAVGDIHGPNNQIVTACGFLQLPFAISSTRTVTCQGNSYVRKVVTGEVVVPFSAQDEHGNLYRTKMEACFGGACDTAISLGIQDYDAVVPLVNRPQWTGSSQYSVKRNEDWDECAYEFRLTIYKRVTNGENVPLDHWWTFSKYITIAH